MAADAVALSEQARAKINLYLHLCGQRPDGYHLLDSLAVFPEVGDVVRASFNKEPGLEIFGPHAQTLSDQPVCQNLVLRAAEAMAKRADRAMDVSLRLEKNLPVASGIGGGSSDAAAAMRLLSRIWECDVPSDLALTLGADVPVCLRSPEPTRMQGIGEILTAIPQIPEFGIVLVNPGVEVPTGAVFSAIEDKNPPPGPAMPERFQDFEEFVQWLGLQRNDLQPAAETICPEIGKILEALTEAPIARMSGSGATCFGLYPSVQKTNEAAKQLSSDFPDWWIASANASNSLQTH